VGFRPPAGGLDGLSPANRRAGEHGIWSKLAQGCDGNCQQELVAEPAHSGVSGGQRAREAAAAPEDKVYGCKVCEMRFISKNQLFKHLGTGGECSRLTGAIEKRDLKTVSLHAKAEQWLLNNNPFCLEAPRLGFAQITEHMVSHYQCNLEAQTKKGETALHLAAYFGHAKVVKTLLDLGANAAHQNHRGETALDSVRVAQDEFNKGKFKFLNIAPGKGVRAVLRSQAQASSTPFANIGSTRFVRFDLRTYDVDWPHWTREGGVIQMLIST
jgi:hypothetical protein